MRAAFGASVACLRASRGGDVARARIVGAHGVVSRASAACAARETNGIGSMRFKSAAHSRSSFARGVAGTRASRPSARYGTVAHAYADADGVGAAFEGDIGAERKHLILVDGLSFVFRAYYGWSARGDGLQNAAGEDTGVLYSYANTICSLLELRPTHLAVCFDAKGKTFRHEMFVEYKANRPPTPEPLLDVIPKVENLVRDMGVPLLRLSGVEADDIIGTMTRRAADDGFHVSIVSPDKDFYQLLSPRVRMLRPSKTNKGDPFEPFTVEDFRVMHDHAIEPKQFVDFLALVGDSSDNIPGVEGVGPKTALPLLERYGDIETILANAATVKGKRARESLLSEKGAASAVLSRRLVEIRQNLTVPSLNEPFLPLDDLRVKPPADGGLAAMRAFERYELANAAERWKRVVRL